MAEPRKETIRNIKGTPNYPRGTDKKILVVLEDTGYAYNFYKNFLIKCFSIPEADILGTGGIERFENRIRHQNCYDAYVVIYDNGINDPETLEMIRDELNELKDKTDAPIYLFTPECFEEVLLSFAQLDRYVDNNKNTEAYEVYKALQNVMNGYADINYFAIKNDIKSKEQKIEYYLEELTDNTAFEFKHGQRGKNNAVMSPCWIYDCCEISVPKENEIKIGCKKVIMGDANNKLDLIADQSLLGVFANMINTLLGYSDRKRKVTRLNKEKYDALVGRLQ